MPRGGHRILRSQYSGGNPAPPANDGSEPVFGAGDTLLISEGFEDHTQAVYQSLAESTPVGTFRIAASPGGDGTFVPGRTGGNAWRLSYTAPTYQQIHYLLLYGTNEANVGGTDFNDGWDANHGLLITQWWARVLIAPPLTQFEGWRLKYFMMFMREPAFVGGGGYGTRLQMNTADNPGVPAGSLWQALMGPYDTDSSAQAVVPSATDTVNAGAWYRNTVAFQPNTAIGARNGLARLWINGTKVVDISASAAGVTPPGGYKTWCDITDVDTLGLCNPVPPATLGTVMDQWVGALRWWDIDTTVNNSFTCDTDDIKIWNRARIVSP